MTKQEAEVLAVEIAKDVKLHVDNQKEHNLITIDTSLLIAQIYARILHTRISLVD